MVGPLLDGGVVDCRELGFKHGEIVHAPRMALCQTRFSSLPVNNV
jgi:hypothetical protein